MTAHTPGPWRVGDAGASVFGPPMTDGSLAFRVSTITASAIPTPTQRANARLIAAAPDLLAALQTIQTYLTDNCLDEAWALPVPFPVDIPALLARATGGGSNA
jgi:hypothetical protein